MNSERKPLAIQNGLSNMPMAGSRLKPPASRLKAPQNYKRARSPDEEIFASSCKKTRLSESEEGDKATNASNAVISRPSSIPCSGTQLKKNFARTLPRANSSTSNSCSSLDSTVKAVGNGLKKPGITSKANLITGAKPAQRNQPNSAKDAGKKRPAWDLKGRLQDMEAALNKRQMTSQSLQSQLESYNQRIAQLESQKEELHGDVAKRAEQAQFFTQLNKDLQQKLRDVEKEMDTVRSKLQREIEDLTFSKSTLERQNAALEGELTASVTEINGLKYSVAQLTSAQAKIASELESSKLSLEQASLDILARNKEIHELKEILAEREATIEKNCRTIIQHETMRRQLHNTIQELKGNIRVFCRVRPLIREELVHTDGVIAHMNFPHPDNKTLELDRLPEMSMNESTLLNNRRGNNKYEFSFDRVFTPETSQAEVFEEISQLIQCALDGYNVCIFAYGQTGSGKTYTMEGGLTDEETKGMIPRAVRQIFNTAEDLKDKGWEYKFTTSFVEIYNETIGDLLYSQKDKSLKYEIRLNGKDSVTVTNLTTCQVTTEEQVAKLLKQASENRAVAVTKCNEHSSRSHTIFMLQLTGNNHITSETCRGTLNLVDLAGSERLKESGSEGQRLKETQAINKSLSHLGNVIMALGNKESHIPYRDSKLTFLLQNCLGGNSKTLMFVNVSPKEEHFAETLNSLRFATKVNQCQIGTAQKRSK